MSELSRIEESEVPREKIIWTIMKEIEMCSENLVDIWRRKNELQQEKEDLNILIKRKKYELKFYQQQ